MRFVGVVASLLLLSGCATTRVVHVDAGDGRKVVHESVAVDPVRVSEDEFKAALTQLILDVRMDVAFRETDAADQRGWVRSRTLLASSRGFADSGSGSSPESLYARLCPDGDGCLTLVGETGLTFSRKDRTLMALSFALDTVWESVEAEELYEPLNTCIDKTGYQYTGCPFRDRCLSIRSWEEAQTA